MRKIFINFTTLTTLTALTSLSLATTRLSAETLSVEDEMERLFSLPLEALMSLDVFTSSRSAEKRSDVPGNIIVVTREQINARGYRNLGDALQDLPGIGFRDNTSVIFQHRVTMRGVSGLSPFLILQNGFRINSPTGEGVPIDDNFPLQHIKQIEVLYGPSSAMYGADAFAGVVNLITYTTTEQDQTEFNTSFTDDDGFHNGVMTQLQFDRFEQPLDLLISATKSSNSNGDLYQDYASDFVLTDLLTFNGDIFTPAAQRNKPIFDTHSQSLFVNLNYGENLNLSLNHSRQNHSTARGEVPNQVNYAANPRWITNLNSVNLSYKQHLAENLQTTTLLSYSLYEVDPSSRFNNIFPNYQDGFKYSEGEEREWTQTLDWQINDNHEMVSGLTLERFHSIPKTVDLSRPFNPNRSVNDQGLFYANTNDQIPVNIFDVNYHNAGVYAQFKSRWQGELTSVLGARYDKSSNYGSTFNPRLGLIYQLRNDLTLKLMHGEAYLAPSAFQSYQHFGSFSSQREDGLYQSFFFHLPNENLKPEEITTTEWLADWRASDSLNLTLSIYHQQLDNLITERATPQPLTDYISGGFIAFSQRGENVGSSTINGIDLIVNYQRSFAVMDVELLASYSWLDGEGEQDSLPNSNNNDSANATPLPFTTKHKVKASLTLSRGPWQFSPKFSYTDKSYSFFNDAEGANRTSPGFAITDLHFGYQYSETLRLTLDVDNLFDKKHYFASWGSADFVLSPQDRRRLRVGLRYQFE